MSGRFMTKARKYTVQKKIFWSLPCYESLCATNFFAGH